MSMLYVFLGGGFGCLLRYLISIATQYYIKSNLPIATFFSNFISCLVLGIILLWLKSKTGIPASSLRLFLVVGFCGGLSTFSTFSLETVELVRSENYLIAILNVLFSIVSGFAIILYLLNKGN